MTVQFFEETASTGYDSPPRDEAYSPISTDPGASRGSAARVARPGLLVAGFLIAAALTTGNAPEMSPVANYFGRRRLDIAAESGTAEAECDPELVRQVREIFERGANEFFEDGMHSRFSRALLGTLTRHGRPAFKAVEWYLFSTSANSDVVSEALRWLADFRDPSTLTERWTILQRTLHDRSPRVRDGAILGFAALDDARALPLLIQARETERIAELRRLLDAVIGQLNVSAHVSAPANRPREPLA